MHRENLSLSSNTQTGPLNPTRSPSKFRRSEHSQKMKEEEEEGESKEKEEEEKEEKEKETKKETEKQPQVTYDVKRP